jgi:putative tryptophan/tyrosine transport system substrate-binding protein
MMRREFIAGLGASALPIAARAQQSTKPYRICQISPWEGTEHLAKAFEGQLAELGYVQGKNIKLQNLFVSPEPTSIEDAIRSVLPDIDLLVVWSTLASVIAKKVVANSVPIVFLSVGVPVDIGLVSTLSRPGGNLTGMTFEASTETYGKRLQMLKDIQPSLGRVAVLRAQGDPNVVHAIGALESAASLLGIRLSEFEIDSARNLPTVFGQLERSRAEALVSVAGAFTCMNSKTIGELSLKHRLPSCHGFKETVASGGLLSLGPNMVTIAIQGASLDYA